MCVVVRRFCITLRTRSKAELAQVTTVRKEEVDGSRQCVPPGKILRDSEHTRNENTSAFQLSTKVPGA